MVVGAISATSLAATWTVDDDGKADFSTIQAAVDATSNGDEIVVSQGTYLGGIDMLGKAVWLRSNNGPEVTSIIGNGEFWGINCSTGETNKTRIDGFTISQCYDSGIKIYGSSPTITNCIFDSNTTIANGGGVNCRDNSYPIINDCLFVNNSTTNDYYPGGGIISTESNPIIANTVFCGNWPNQICGEWTDGGGTCISFSCDDSDGDGIPDECGTVGDGKHYVPEEYETIHEAVLAAGDHDEIIVGPGIYSACGSQIPDTVFLSVIDAGGKRLWIHSSSGPEKTIIEGECPGARTHSGEHNDTIIEGFTFLNQTSGPSELFLCSPKFVNCFFEDGMYGVSCQSGSPTFDSCNFNNIYSTGYGVFRYGGYENGKNPLFSNCVFSNNHASSDGVVICDNYGDPDYNIELVNCLFENNVVEYGGSFGGSVVVADSGNLFLDSCNFVNNVYGGYAVNCAYGDFLDSTLNISNSVFKNNSGGGVVLGYSLAERKIVDSVFTNNEGGGIYTPISSPELLGTAVCGNGTFQINGVWIDGGGNTVEEVCTNGCCAADITNDGVVGVNDLLFVIDAWSETDSPADVTGDGIVGVNDLLLVVGNWGPC